MLKACEKRSISLESLQTAASDIERQLRETGKGEVTSVEIGELVMDKLRQIDEVAYVRFASVYREFRDLDGLLTEVQRVLSERDAKEKS